MLTSQTTKRLDVPHEPGQWVEIRKLNWRALREASQVQQREASAYLQQLGDLARPTVDAITPEQIRAYHASPTAGFDPATLLRRGIVAWSYSEKPTAEQIDDLDEPLADWLVLQIALLARPPRDEVAEKNG